MSERPFASHLGFSNQKPTKTNTHGPQIMPMWGPYVLDSVGCVWARPFLSHLGFPILKTHHNQHTWAPYNTNVGPICVRLGGFCVGTPICIPPGLSYQKPIKTNTHGPHILPMWGPYVLDWVGSVWHAHLHPTWGVS